MASQPYRHCLKSNTARGPGVWCGCDNSVDFLIVAAERLQLTNASPVSKGLTRPTGWQGFTGRGGWKHPFNPALPGPSLAGVITEPRTWKTL